jgi:hypothetical protein
MGQCSPSEVNTVLNSDFVGEPKLAAVKIVEEFRALMCKRDRTVVRRHDQSPRMKEAAGANQAAPSTIVPRSKGAIGAGIPTQPKRG